MDEVFTPPLRARTALGWLRYRQLPGENTRAVITAADGRFLLLPICAIEADAAQIERLSELGFLLPDVSEAGVDVLSERCGDEGASHHTVFLNDADSPAGMGPAEAAVLTGDILDGSARGFLHLELVNAAALAAPYLPALLRDARAKRTARTEPLSLGVSIPLAAVTPDLVDAVVDARAALTVSLDTSLDGTSVARVRDVHARLQGRGVPPALAFLRVEIPVNRALNAMGVEGFVAAAVRAGLVFVDLELVGTDLAPDEATALHRALLRRILAVNTRGALLVEMRLALHLETLASRGDPSRSPAPTASHHIWRTRGRPVERDAAGAGAGCSGCAYDPYCGRGLLRPALGPDLASRRWGTPFCRTSLARFDAAFELLASPEAPLVRRVFRTWMDAHARIQRRLEGITPSGPA